MLWRSNKSISSKTPSATDVCLNHLGLSHAEYEELNGKRIDKREYIRKVIETSLPSLGRFMSEVYLAYDSRRDKNKGSAVKDYKQLLEAARRITSSDQPTRAQSVQLAVLAYKLSRNEPRRQ